MSIVKFADVAHRVNTKEDRFNTDKIFYVGGEHIDSDELIVTNNGIIKGSTIGPMFYCGFKSGDILFVTRNPHLRKCGLVEFDGICSEKTFVIGTKDKNILSQEYLAIIMQSDDFWNYCEENKSGGVNYFLNWSTLAEYEFDLPPMEEQKTISEKVFAAYRLKQSYKKLLSATDEMVKSQFIEMFEGDKYPRISLDAIADEWLKGQAFKKDEICENGDKHCIHYGELFTKYGPVIKEVVSKTSVELKKPSKNGDILFPASDVTPNGLARCSMLPYDNVVLGGDIIVLRPKEGYSPAYLSYAINQQTTQLLARVNGGLVKHLSAKGLKTIEIPIPSKEKQEEYIRIAEQADKSKFTSLKSQFIEMFGDVDNNTKHYPVKRIKDIADTYAGATPSTSNPAYWDNGVIPWMSSGEVHKGRVEHTDAKITQLGYDRCSTKMVPKHSVVIALAGQGKTRGTVAVTDIDLCTNQSLCAIIPNGEIHYEYLYHNLRGRYNELRSMSGDVNGRGGLNLKHIQSIRLVVPPQGEQQKFVEISQQADKSKYLS